MKKTFQKMKQAFYSQFSEFFKITEHVIIELV